MEISNCVDQESKFKFVDDLTVLEKINLLLAGLASFNCKNSVPSDVSINNQIIPASHLKYQEYIKNINQWTINQKMILNQKKTKVMIFNFTNNFKFTTRMQLNDENIEVVEKTKLLGLIVTNDLKWNENTLSLVKRTNARMELLRKVASCTNSIDDKKIIYISYIRSILEQSCEVWHSSLTGENSDDLERVQKSALKIILADKFTNYEDALIKADLQSLKMRRKELCLSFAKKCLNNNKTESMFLHRVKKHKMKIRKKQKCMIKYANNAAKIVKK